MSALEGIYREKSKPRKVARERVWIAVRARRSERERRDQDLKLGDFGEIELADLHGGGDHVKRLFPAKTERHTHGFNVRKQMNQAFVEPEVADTLANSPIFDQERAVASHAGYDLLVRIDFADVPQPRDQHAAFGRGDHLSYGLRIFLRGENDVHGHLAYFVG